jgi:hypothetical protein
MNQRGRDESLVIINQLLLSAERGAWQKVVTDAEELAPRSSPSHLCFT